jgi:hypothetical protein
VEVEAESRPVSSALKATVAAIARLDLDLNLDMRVKR